MALLCNARADKRSGNRNRRAQPRQLAWFDPTELMYSPHA
jgi:hypothetical protein